MGANIFVNLLLASVRSLPNQKLGTLIPGYLDTWVPCGLPGSHETSDLPSYRDRLHQSTDCLRGHIQTELLAAAESTERPVC